MKKVDVYLAEIERLEDENGRITKEFIVAAAKKKSSPLHDYFDWDDKKAAHKHRLEQAGELLRIRVEVVNDEIRFTVPSHVRDPACLPHEQGYRSTVKIRTDEDAKREVLVKEFSAAASALQRARDLAAFFEIAEEVDSAREIVLTMKDRVSTHVM